MVLGECPFCHVPFAARLLSKVQVESGEATRIADFPLQSSPARGMTKGGVPVGHGSLVPGRSKDDEKGVAINPEAFITFKLTYQCHHCSKEWTKFETESVHLPGEYVEDARED